MALFEYLPRNYVWNLSVSIAIESAAKIGEIEGMCRLLEAGTREKWPRTIPRKMAYKLVELTREGEEKKADRSPQSDGYNGRLSTPDRRTYTGAWTSRSHETYAKAQKVFRHGVTLGRENAERVELPFQETFIPGFDPSPRRRLSCADRAIRQRPRQLQGTAALVMAALCGPKALKDMDNFMAKTSGMTLRSFCPCVTRIRTKLVTRGAVDV